MELSASYLTYLAKFHKAEFERIKSLFKDHKFDESRSNFINVVEDSKIIVSSSKLNTGPKNDPDNDKKKRKLKKNTLKTLIEEWIEEDENADIVLYMLSFLELKDVLYLMITNSDFEEKLEEDKTWARLLSYKIKEVKKWLDIQLREFEVRRRSRYREYWEREFNALVKINEDLEKKNL